MQKSKVISFYDEKSREFYADLPKSPYEFYRQNLITNSLLEEALKGIPENKKLKVLDLGCGNGYFTIKALVKNKNFQVTGSDISKGMIAVSKKHFPEASYCINDAMQLPFKDASFDFIISRELIEHLPDPVKCFEEVNRVLKKDGFVAVSTPSFFGLIAPLYFLKKSSGSMQPIDEWWTPFSLKKAVNKVGLKQSGMKSINFIPYHGSFPGFLVPLIKALDKIISLIPFLNLFGRTLIIKAVKE